LPALFERAILDARRRTDALVGLPEEEARRALPSLRRPFTEAYIFCYQHGRMPLEPGMRGPGSDAFAGRLLTEQIPPSQLRSQFGRVESG
jgi:hypothetical protein